MSQCSTLDVGGEVHQASSAGASGAPAHGAEGLSLGTSGPRQAGLHHHPKAARRSAGRPTCGGASAIARGSPAGNPPTRSWALGPGHASASWGPWPPRCP